MATRKGINISGQCIVSINAMPIYKCAFNSKKMKGPTESYFFIYFKLNDHTTRCFNFGLRRIHSNACKFELN